MKSRRLIYVLSVCIMLMALLMAGCGSNSSETSEAQDASENNASSTQEMQGNQTVTNVSLVSSIEESTEFATINGTDADGNTVWTVETEGYPAAQLTAFAEQEKLPVTSLDQLAQPGISIAVGLSKPFTIGSSYEVLENGVQKSMDKYGHILMSNISNAINVPIALRGTYFLTDQLFVRGTLGFHMINFSIADMLEHEGVFSTIGEFIIDNQIVDYQNKWKAVSFMLSFGYRWE